MDKPWPGSVRKEGAINAGSTSSIASSKPGTFKVGVGSDPVGIRSGFGLAFWDWIAKAVPATTHTKTDRKHTWKTNFFIRTRLEKVQCADFLPVNSCSAQTN